MSLALTSWFPKKVNPNGSRTLYIGNVYEVDKNASGGVTGTRNYYPAAGAGAMRVNSTLYLIRADHLGSASAVTDVNGSVVGRQLYHPYGQTCLVSGAMYTDRLFTGQREMAGLGIYHYNARFYSPVNNHFLSADTIVPGYSNPQSLNRFSYVLNNPLRYTDPTGHMMYEGEGGGKLGCSNPKYCQNGKPKSPNQDPMKGKSGGSGNNNSSPSPTNTPGATPTSAFGTVTPQPTSTATPSYSTYPGQQCTSANPCLNNVIPSITPTATSTTLPLVSSQGVEDAKDLAQYALPSNPVRPNFSPNIDNLWKSLPNALPLINHPAVTPDQIVNSIVDRATKVVEFGANVLANYGQYIISSGISPTIPIVPYFPSADPFAPVYQ